MSATTMEAPVIGNDEGRQLLDAAARRWLNMTREEFIEAWDAGDLANDERLAVQQVAMLLPFGRA